ncbi:SdiA-regulated domain-containing protein [Pseudomonas sp. NPDC089530]|uniref:SdiA-regulated domain-containing protein n=1 Tax=Pseudomonas sp. NPDC089530 TaxID=3390651 RepID=UPI003CFF2D01
MNTAVKLPQVKRRSRHWLRTVLWSVVLIGAVLSSVAVVKFHWHDRLYFYVVSQLDAARWVGKSIWLPDYKVVIDAKPVVGIEDDLSAITYDYDQDRLLAMTNAAPYMIVALSKSGEILERYPLQGFDDPEGLTYMGDGWMAVADENFQQLGFFKFPERPGTVIDAKDTQFLALGINLSQHNKGFEGVTYDAANDRLFVTKERDPRQLYEISGVKKSLEGKLQIKVLDLTAWVDRSFFGKDISDLYYDPKTGHLVMLSQESALMVELSDKGEMVSFRTLLGRFSDLKESTYGAEGLTMDNDGNLYVVSEPNLFYLFRKQ